jgi:PAS domain S-box-containing protein
MGQRGGFHLQQQPAQPDPQVGAVPPTRARRLRHLVLALGALAVVSVLAGTVLSLWRMHDEVTQLAERHLLGLAQVLAEQTLRSMHTVDAILRAAAEDVQRTGGRDQLTPSLELHQQLREIIAQTPYVSALIVSDASGRLVAHTAGFPPPPIDYGDSEFFRAHRDNPAMQARPSPPVVGRTDGERAITVSRGLNDPDGRFRGVIAAVVDPAYFLGPQGLHELGPDGVVRLLRRDGVLLTGYPVAIAAATRNYRDSAVFTQGVGTGRELIHHGGTAVAGERISAIRLIDGYPLVVTVTSSVDFVLRTWYRSAALFGAIAAVTAVFLSLIALSLARQLRLDEELKSVIVESEERLQAIIQSAMDAIITVDAHQRIVLFNAAAEQIFRCPGAKAIGADVGRFIRGHLLQPQTGYVAGLDAARASMRKMGQHLALTGVGADGVEFPVDASVSQVQLRGTGLYIVILRDVTERRRAEQEIKRSQQELRGLAKAANKALEAERRRTARELHDELGQSLTALKMDLESVRSALPPGQPDLAQRTQAMHALLDSTIAATRRIAADLRPLMLDDLGLAAALDWLTHNFSKHTGIATDLVIDDSVAQVPEPIASALYRITQESLTNVAKYAQATMAEIRLERDGDWVQLLVRDNGRGIEAADQDKRGAFGLLGIRERVSLLGGEVAIKGERGQGSELVARIPLAAADAEAVA